MIRYAFASLALTMLFATGLIAADETRRFESTNHQFAITLPAGWEEVEVATAPFGTVFRRSDHAYRIASETNFAIFINVDNERRTPEAELALLENEQLRQQVFAASFSVMGTFLDSSYDSKRHFLRMSMTAQFAGTGTLRMLVGMQFTEKGTFSITCAAPVEHFKSVGPVFSKALDTFYIDPSLTYRERPGAAGIAKEVASEGKGRTKFRFGWIVGLTFLVMFLGRRLISRSES
jgi:hypothetical protein